MNRPDFEGARDYALKRLETEISPSYYYHNITHTRDEVIPAIDLFLEKENINGTAPLILRTAGYFHDIGFTTSFEQHEVVGVRIARAVLPDYHYSPEQVDAISGLIIATRLPQMPKTHLEKLIADADLSVLGNTDFLDRNYLLYLEQVEHVKNISITDWYQDQIKFLKQHNYFTPTAQHLKNSQKSKNIRSLEYQLIKFKV